MAADLPGLATKLNATTAAATKARATLTSLATTDPADAGPLLAGGLQSAKQAAAAAFRLARQYVVGKRALDDIKNATIKTDLEAFEAARLEVEAGWLGGEKRKKKKEWESWWIAAPSLPWRRQSTHTLFPTIGTTPSFIELDAVPTSAATATDITCYVDPDLGIINNVRQGTVAACTAGGTQVVLPTAGKYVTNIELAIDKQLPFVGRLTVHARDSLHAKPTVHTCGWAGGDSVSLFPSGHVAVRLDGEYREKREKGKDKRGDVKALHQLIPSPHTTP